MTSRTILIHHEHPPIPQRNCDYVAMFQGEEESQQYGYGATPQEALDDLLDSPLVSMNALLAILDALAKSEGVFTWEQGLREIRKHCRIEWKQPQLKTAKKGAL